MPPAACATHPPRSSADLSASHLPSPSAATGGVAVDPQLSVSRIGSRAYHPAMEVLAPQVRSWCCVLLLLSCVLLLLSCVLLSLQCVLLLVHVCCCRLVAAGHSRTPIPTIAESRSLLPLLLALCGHRVTFRCPPPSRFKSCLVTHPFLAPRPCRCGSTWRKPWTLLVTPLPWTIRP